MSVRHLTGMYDVPVRCRQRSRSLRTEIDEAWKYFLAMFPDDQPPNART